MECRPPPMPALPSKADVHRGSQNFRFVQPRFLNPSGVTSITIRQKVVNLGLDLVKYIIKYGALLLCQRGEEAFVAGDR